MKKEIVTEADVQLLISSFYKKILQDDLLSPLFQHAVKNNWEKHLQVMTKFWMNVLFYSGGYSGNPLQVHQQIHYYNYLTTEHFHRWLQLFLQTVDELFEGEKAVLAKKRAHAIATVMQVKIIPPQNPAVEDSIY